MAMTIQTRAALAMSLLMAACAQPQVQTDGPVPVGTRFSDADIQATEPGKATCVASSPADNAAVVQATNAVRSRAGLPPVRANPKLAQAAMQHACDMATRGRMAHHGSQTTGPAQRAKAFGYRPSITAENIAAGPFDLNRVLAEWSGSQGHRANILLPQIREVGIGHAVGSDGRTHYWAAVYAAPRTR